MTIPVRGDRVFVAQKCCLPDSHEGPHRSLSNVTKAAA